MKTLRILPVLGASVVFVSCGVMDKLSQPIGDTGYNPLDRPGMKSRGGTGLANSNEHGFKNGDIVEVVIPNTALFAKVPEAGDRYVKVLKVGDTLRVIGGEKDFIKILTETGEVGFVSSVMVVTQGFLTDTGPIDPNVTVVGANETPIIPDIAPDPTVPGIGSPDPAPSVDPAAVPNIIAPEPVVPDPAPVVPDPKPVVPSLPDEPAPEPSNSELPE